MPISGWRMFVRSIAPFIARYFCKSRFFFSSRRRHTRYIGDWSSTVLFRSGVHRTRPRHLTSTGRPLSRPPIPQRNGAGVSLGATIVLRVDGTITLAHSGKEQAEGTFKKSYGFHSLGVWVDNTGELAALMPRPGGAGSNTAADLIEVLRQAIGQIPANRRGDLLVTS